MDLCDPLFTEYLKDAEIIEKFDVADEVTGVFLKQGEKGLPIMDYPYRLVCFRKGEGKLLFTVNLEISIFGTCFFGVDKGDSHWTLKPGTSDMPYEEFRKEAAEIARKVIAGELCRDVNPEELYFFD